MGGSFEDKEGCLLFLFARHYIEFKGPRRNVLMKTFR